MNHTLIVNTLLVGTPGVVLMRLFQRLLIHREQLPVSTDWISDLSASRYLPMERLLGSEDYEFLAAHPACGEQRASRLRRERRRIFRTYLQCLKTDFSRVHTALQMIMVQSTYDRPDLGIMLLRQKAVFQAGILRVEFRLALHACGCVRGVDVRSLVGALDGLSCELQRIIPAPPRTAGAHA